MSKEFNEAVHTNPQDHGSTGALEKFAADYWSKNHNNCFGVTMDKPAATISDQFKIYDPEDEFAKTHLTKDQYDQYQRESSLLYKIGYYMTGKDTKDEYPMHDLIKREMAEETKHDLSKDNELASVMFKDDPRKQKAFEKETAEIEKFRKEHPGEALDINKFPQHKLVEEVIAKMNPVGIQIPDSPLFNPGKYDPRKYMETHQLDAKLL